MAQGFVDTRHGCIHYTEEGTGKPRVLLHSNSTSVHQYADTMAGFVKNWRVLAMDMPGRGDSDPVTRHRSVTK